MSYCRCVTFTVPWKRCHSHLSVGKGFKDISEALGLQSYYPQMEKTSNCGKPSQEGPLLPKKRFNNSSKKSRKNPHLPKNIFVTPKIFGKTFFALTRQKFAFLEGLSYCYMWHKTNTAFLKKKIVPSQTWWWSRVSLGLLCCFRIWAKEEECPAISSCSKAWAWCI